MVSIIRLFPDMTFEERTVKTQSDQFKVGENKIISFKIGTSVFKERRSRFQRLKFWKKRRNLLLWVNDTPSAMHLEGSNPHPALTIPWGTEKDISKMINRVVNKSKAEQKPISNTQFFVLAILGILNLVFMFMLMRGVNFG